MHRLEDPALSALDELMDAPRARVVLAAALQGIGEVDHVRLTQVRHDRGRRVVVRYAVQGRWPEGWSPVQTLVAEHGTAAPPEGAAVVGDADRRVAVWRYPFDPHLPGLAPAAHLHPVQAMVRGWAGAEDGRTPTRVVPMSYRPTRRAVLRVVAEGVGGASVDVCYLKVVRPHVLARIHGAHTSTGERIRVPPVLSTSPEQGVLVLGALSGETLRERLLGSGRPPPPTRLLALQRDLLSTPADGAPPARAAASDHHADVLARLLPHRQVAVRRVADVARAAAEADRRAGGPVGIVHGDLYEGQVIVDGDGGLSLLDLDGVGTGALLDDCATVLAHLHVLAGWRPARAPAVRSWARAYQRACARLVDPRRLRHRAAGVVLGLAAGGFAIQETGWRSTAEVRLALATTLADIDEESLMRISSPRHPAPSG